VKRIPLPIDDVLPALIAALGERGAVVLRAPTGAGKTTRVPPAILDAGLAGDGAVVLLEPRRVAARAAARRIAEERGARVGESVGYRVRFDNRTSAATRIIVATEGVLLRMLQDDPFLEGIGAVVLDEFHERSLDADLALSLSRRVREDARPDLQLVVMSATLDPLPLATYLDAAVIESEGFLHPVEVQYLDRPDDRWLDEQVASGVRRALTETDGDVLAFLPGVGEIRGTARRLSDLKTAGIDVFELFGNLPPDKQDRALRKGKQRRVVLATNVAETSVTVDGVTAVVDSGWARVMRHDPAVGMDKLALARISQTSITQRTGRAGRTAPGVCFRLWTRNEERVFPRVLEPEIRRLELAGAALQLMAWGETDLAAFPWFEAPGASRLDAARDLLQRLGAVEGATLTQIGHSMSRLPVHPRIARMLLEGHRLGHPRRTAGAAALLSERDPFRGGPRSRKARHHGDSDIADRLDALAGRGGRDDLPRVEPGAAQWIGRVRDDLFALVRRTEGAAPRTRISADEAMARALLAGFPDRLARRREPGSDRAVMVGGRGVKLAPSCAVRDAELFVCVDVDAGRREERAEAIVRAASAVSRAWLAADRLQTTEHMEFDAAGQRVVGSRRTSFDDLVLDEVVIQTPRGREAQEVLAAAAADNLAAALRLDDENVVSLRTRVACLREWRPDLELPAMDDDAIRSLLPVLVRGRRSFAETKKAPLLDVLRGRLDWKQMQALDHDAPERIAVPSGSRIRLTYEAGRAPVLPVRIQEVFGLRATPSVASGRVKVLLHLLAPNQRAQQVTDDLPSFWANTYPLVRAELRRRYPKHAWPEDPLTARPERRPGRRKRS